MQKEFLYKYVVPTVKGQKTIIDIPFNVWDEFDVRGPVSVNVCINDNLFQSSLIPKGNGFYMLFFTKDMKKIVKPNDGDTLNMVIELRKIEPPSPRIPINPKDARKIEKIKLVKEPVKTACGQVCIAMLAGVSIDDVFQVMKTKGSTSAKMLLDALYHYKIRNNEKFISIKKNPNIPELCILNVRMPTYGHWVVYYKGVFYDPEFGELNNLHKNAKIVNYLEIYT